MAIVKMQKVAVLTHRSKMEETLSLLQEEGVMEIVEGSTPTETPYDIQMNFDKAELAFARGFLIPHANKSVLSSMDKPVSPEQIERAAQGTDFRALLDRIKEIESEQNSLAAAKIEKEREREELLPWKTFPYAEFSDTGYTKTILGTIDARKLEEFEKRLAIELPRTATEGLHSEKKNMTRLVVHVWKEDEKRFEELATELGWTETAVPHDMLRDVSERLSACDAVLREISQREEVLSKELSHLSKELPNIVRMEIYLSWVEDKQRAREALIASPYTATLLGWVPAKEVRTLEATLHRIAPATAVIEIEPEEGEDAPILLKNSKWIAPFRSVTTLYGLPKSGEADPTAALSPFFILFFALCLTDAGYGFVLALLTGLYIFIKKIKVEENTLLWLLFMSGIMTIIVSIPFGGWFGFAPTQVPEFLTYETAGGQRLFLGQIWNLSEESGVTFLQNLALALGITHLAFGMFLAGAHKWMHGQKAAAFWIDFTSHLLFAAVLFKVFGPASLETAKDIVLYGAIILFVWGKGHGNAWYLRPIFGLLGAMNFAIGLLSNSLSYLRILALGLVTGAIAFAVDQVAFELGKLFPIWLGIPVILLVLFAGHMVSIALNVLGAFIHSGRLQFIEFFSQFFEGGGRSFTPFRRILSR